MRNIQVNVSRDISGAFMYSIEPKTPSHTTFVHDFNVQDQITWRYSVPGQRLEVAFPDDICPFALANGTSWPNKKNTSPEQPSKIDTGFDMKRLYSRIKYSVTLLDASGKGLATDDPEVIIVDA